jgi:hypothetical protein
MHEDIDLLRFLLQGIVNEPPQSRRQLNGTQLPASRE